MQLMGYRRMCGFDTVEQVNDEGNLLMTKKVFLFEEKKLSSASVHIVKPLIHKSVDRHSMK